MSLQTAANVRLATEDASARKVVYIFIIMIIFNVAEIAQLLLGPELGVSVNWSAGKAVLKRCRKIVSDGAEIRCAGRLFQRLAAETGKARRSTV